MSELSRPVAIDRVGTGGLEMVVEARPDELPAIAARLMLPAVGRLGCRFRLRRLERSVIEAAGTLEAAVTQTCVVTLDAFEQVLAEAFVVRFVPAGSESEDDDPDSPDEIPYPAGTIDLGEAAVEQLALALDPYPRKPGVAEPDAAPAGGPHPFAALAGLRRPH